VKSVLDGTDGLKLEPDRDVNGHNRKSLYVDQTEGPDIRMLVDPETKRIDIIELVYDLKGVNSEQPRERQFQEVTLVWRAGDVSTQVPDETFQFKPPPDFEKVEATAEAPGAEDPKDEKPADKGKKADGGAAGKDKNAEAAAEEPSPVEKFVGKPAPDFTLTVLDSEGKTKKVTKADLAGKVVLIDFWATWCPPCIKELPEIQKLVDLLGDVKDDVAVVALSEDAEPTDLPGLRTLVEKSLKENSVKLAEGPVSMVAIDLEGKVGNSFKVDGLPTLVLIDPKGTVQAVHVGFTEHADVVLGEQIVALLQGKTLTKPGDTPKP
jgi:thiol-disulfide isomerase/thioredoxin